MERGQSPGKQIAGMRVVREDGSVAGPGWMLLRDAVIRWIGFSVLGLILGLAGEAGTWIFFLIALAAAAWCLWDARTQCLWDKLAQTLVVDAAAAPVGATAATAGTSQTVENLETLAEMRARGLLTDEEYEERRAREVERL